MLSLQDREWGEFALSKVFAIKSTSSSIDKIKLDTRAGLHPYVTRSDTNNGINAFVCKQPNYRDDEGNCITIGLDTQTAFYQPTAFYTGQNIQVLRNDCLNAHNAKFIIPLLRNVMTVFSWGSNGATLTRLKRSKILLPVTLDGIPDWQFMEEYVKEREAKLLGEYIAYTGNNCQRGG